MKCSDGSILSKANGGGWEDLGKDRVEPSLQLSIRADVSLITEIEILTGGRRSAFPSKGTFRQWDPFAASVAGEHPVTGPILKKY